MAQSTNISVSSFEKVQLPIGKDEYDTKFDADFFRAIWRGVDAMKDAVVEAEEEILEEVAKETVQVIRQNARAHGLSSKYANSIRKRHAKRKDYRRTGSVYRIHATGKYNKTAHLVENSHVTRIESGKYGKKVKTRAYPHFSVGAEYADKRIEELAEKIIDDKIAKMF